MWSFLGLRFLGGLGRGLECGLSWRAFGARLAHAVRRLACSLLALDALALGVDVGVEAGLHFLAFFGALLGFPAALAAVRAVFSATATACFCGMPAFISLEMFLLIDWRNQKDWRFVSKT